MTVVYGPLIGGDGPPLGKTYLSMAVTEDGVERAFVPGTRLRVEIGKGGGLNARAGCNGLSGLIMLDDGVLRFERGIVTQMNCGPEVCAQEDWLFGILGSEPRWVVDGDTLTLTSGGTTIVLLDHRFAEPDLPLDRTTWTVKSSVRADGNGFRRYGPAGPATLTLDGTRATGSTGRNFFTATVTRDDTTLTFTHLTIGAAQPPSHPALAGAMLSDRAAALERAVLENLGTPLTYAIEANHLQLRGPTRTTGLNLTAPHPLGTWEPVIPG